MNNANTNVIFGVKVEFQKYTNQYIIDADDLSKIKVFISEQNAQKATGKSTVNRKSNMADDGRKVTLVTAQSASASFGNDRKSKQKLGN